MIIRFIFDIVRYIIMCVALFYGIEWGIDFIVWMWDNLPFLAALFNGYIGLPLVGWIPTLFIGLIGLFVAFWIVCGPSYIIYLLIFSKKERQKMERKLNNN